MAKKIKGHWMFKKGHWMRWIGVFQKFIIKILFKKNNKCYMKKVENGVEQEEIGYKYSKPKI